MQSLPRKLNQVKHQEVFGFILFLFCLVSKADFLKTFYKVNEFHVFHTDLGA